MITDTPSAPHRTASTCLYGIDFASVWVGGSTPKSTSYILLPANDIKAHKESRVMAKLSHTWKTTKSLDITIVWLLLYYLRWHEQLFPWDKWRQHLYDPQGLIPPSHFWGNHLGVREPLHVCVIYYRHTVGHPARNQHIPKDNYAYIFSFFIPVARLLVIQHVGNVWFYEH